MKYEVDFYKNFKLVPPVCGIVNRIEKPKGIRKIEPDGKTYYRLYSDSFILYNGEKMSLEPGLYWVLDVCKVKGAMTWNQYLFVLEKDGSVYAIAEYLNQNDSSWVVEAMKPVKKFFRGEATEPITLSKIDYKLVVTARVNLKDKKTSGENTTKN